MQLTQDNFVAIVIFAAGIMASLPLQYFLLHFQEKNKFRLAAREKQLKALQRLYGVLYRIADCVDDNVEAIYFEEEIFNNDTVALRDFHTLRCLSLPNDIRINLEELLSRRNQALDATTRLAMLDAQSKLKSEILRAAKEISSGSGK